MEVIHKPDIEQPDSSSGGNPPPNNDRLNTGRKDKPPFRRGSRTVVILRSVAFVMCGAMFIIAMLFTALTLFVTSNQPYLAPNVQDEILHQDKVYIKFDDENFYRDLVIIRSKIADPEDREVTQITQGRPFKLIFTPKQSDVPENYRIFYREPGREAENTALEQQLERRIGRDREGSFDVVTLSIKDGKWPTGKFLIFFQEGGMYGGTLYAYFSVVAPQ
jgi:hypothetical protein